MGTCAEVFVSLAQNAMVSVKELCGLPPIASLKQCILTLSSRLVSSDNAPSVALCMKDTFPYLEPLGTVPDVQKKVLAAYDLVSTSALLPLPFPAAVNGAGCARWLSHAQMFQLNKQGSSSDWALQSWPSHHNACTLGFLLLFPFLNTFVASTGWHLKRTLFTKLVAIQPVLALSLSLGSSKICVLPFACLPAAEHKASSTRPTLPFPTLCSSTVKCCPCPCQMKSLLLLGRAWQSWKGRLKCPFSCTGKERSVWYRNAYTNIETQIGIVPDECCCSLYDICHCCG